MGRVYRRGTPDHGPESRSALSSRLIAGGLCCAAVCVTSRIWKFLGLLLVISIVSFILGYLLVLNAIT